MYVCMDGFVAFVLLPFFVHSEWVISKAILLPVAFMIKIFLYREL